MARPSVALALIAKNEEKNLPQLFRSFKDCFDEVHLTDTGSTDSTVAIAKALGAQVHEFKWVNDFSAARNASFDPVKTDFVMWLDCDDVLQDADGFIRWRDDVMMLADYWAAPYHYSSDAAGKPNCSFARERVFRRAMGYQWKYFLHEGVVPVHGTRAQFTGSWAVRHVRTAEDMAQDRSRNLGVFEINMKAGPLDARMQYYYGKELFEARRPADAIPVLLKALEDPTLELHDRVLGIQWLAYSYAQIEQLDQAMHFAHVGLEIDPRRAEFLTLIGDLFVKKMRLVDAIPYYAAAKACTPNTPALGASAIFHNPDMYTIYPRVQLAKAYANIGNMEAAEKEAEEGVTMFNNHECGQIREEVAKQRRKFGAYKSAVQTQDIVFTCPPQTAYEFDPGIAKTKAMGGSETALIEMAGHLKRLTGRPVKVFNMRAADGVFDGVEYISANKTIDYMAQYKPAVHIAWRHSMKITDAPTFVWSHDLMTPGVENVMNYDQVMCLTPFHKRYMMATQGVPEPKIMTTRNGINPDDFPPYDLATKDPNMFVFSSSPDRGLDRAMLVLDKVREKYPDIKLHVYYGIEHLPKWGHQALHDKLKEMIAARPWVIYHGATEKTVMYADFRKAAYCVQPSDFIETSKISAREMLYCGVYQITRKIGGLVDTMMYPDEMGMCSLVDSECISPAEYQVYVDATMKAVDEKAYTKIYGQDPSGWSWACVAKDWIDQFGLRA